MPFRDRFDCLWCGTPHVTRAPSDLEGWAQLCPTCLGKAGTNAFLRARLRTALAERGRAAAATGSTASAGDGARRRRRPGRHAAHGTDAGPRPARRPAPSPTTGSSAAAPFEHGAIHDTAWDAELDVVTRWLDGLGAPRPDRRAGGGTRVLLAAAGGAGRAPCLGRGRRRARPRARSPRRAPAPRPPPRRGPVDRPRAAVARTPSSPRFLAGRVRGAGLDRALASLRERLAARRPARARSTCGPTRRAARPTGSPGRGTTRRRSRRPSAGRASTGSASRRPAASSCSRPPRPASRARRRSPERAEPRCYPPARCHPSRTGRSPRSAPA